MQIDQTFENADYHVLFHNTHKFTCNNYWKFVILNMGSMADQTLDSLQNTENVKESQDSLATNIAQGDKISGQDG